MLLSITTRLLLMETFVIFTHGARNVNKCFLGLQETFPPVVLYSTSVELTCSTGTAIRVYSANIGLPTTNCTVNRTVSCQPVSDVTQFRGVRNCNGLQQCTSTISVPSIVCGGQRIPNISVEISYNCMNVSATTVSVPVTLQTASSFSTVRLKTTQVEASTKSAAMVSVPVTHGITSTPGRESSVSTRQTPSSFSTVRLKTIPEETSTKSETWVTGSRGRKTTSLMYDPTPVVSTSSSDDGPNEKKSSKSTSMKNDPKRASSTPSTGTGTSDKDSGTLTVIVTMSVITGVLAVVSMVVVICAYRRGRGAKKKVNDRVRRRAHINEIRRSATENQYETTNTTKPNMSGSVQRQDRVESSTNIYWELDFDTKTHQREPRRFLPYETRSETKGPPTSSPLDANGYSQVSFKERSPAQVVNRKYENRDDSKYNHLFEINSKRINRYDHLARHRRSLGAETSTNIGGKTGDRQRDKFELRDFSHPSLMGVSDQQTPKGDEQPLSTIFETQNDNNDYHSLNGIHSVSTTGELTAPGVTYLRANPYNPLFPNAQRKAIRQPQIVSLSQPNTPSIRKHERDRYDHLNRRYLN